MKMLAVPLLPGMCRAAETGRALKADVLRSAPYSDARKTGVIVRGETLQILTKKGAWLNVKNGKRASGWVRLLSVRRGTAGGLNPVLVGRRPRRTILFGSLWRKNIRFQSPAAR